jgi:pimeloyl-ACP methyl ester carboxylesterase
VTLRSARALAALTLPVLLASCAAGSGPVTAPPVSPTVLAPPAPAELGSGEHVMAIDGETAVVVVPEQLTGRLVVYLHGYGGDASSLTDPAGLEPLTEGLVAAGYAVASSDAGGDAWGNAASVDAYAALAATVTAQVAAREVYLVAESMGGLAGAQLVDGGRIAGLRAYAGIYPLCDLSSVYADYANSIDAAHAPAVGAALDALSPVALDDADVPVQFWASPEDTTVDKERNADVCAAEVRAAGGRVDVVETEGDHGDPSNFDLAALLAFFASAAG